MSQTHLVSPLSASKLAPELIWDLKTLIFKRLYFLGAVLLENI